MSSITFRPAESKDLPLLYDFEQGVISAERPFDQTLKSGHINYYDLKALLASDNAEIIVAEWDDQVIGSGYAQLKEAKDFQAHSQYGYLGFMYVEPTHRGKGVISKILEELKSWCKSRAVYEIRLDVYSGNMPAVKAYEKSGFSKNLVEMRMEIDKDPS